MRRLGIIKDDVVPHPVVSELAGGQEYVQWEQMTAEQQAKSARAMETYAGMVDNIDMNIGRTVDYLDSIGETESKRVGCQATTSNNLLQTHLSVSCLITVRKEPPSKLEPS